MTTVGTLTLAGMLHDPLIRMVMQSDGVSEDDLSTLLFRVKAVLAARHAADPMGEGHQGRGARHLNA